MPKSNNPNGNNHRRFTTQASLDSYVWSICDILRRSNCAGALQYKINRLPTSLLQAAGAGVKTNLLFFTKGKPTEKIWYYDLSDIKVGKKSPLTVDPFDDFFRLLPTRGDSERSWTVTREEIEARGYDLKAVNPNAKTDEDLRKLEELLDLIKAKGREVSEALGKLRQS